MPKTRRERRIARNEIYLQGKARSPHLHTPTLRRSLEKDGQGSISGSTSGTGANSGASSASGICPQCAPVLVRYADTFKEMVHQGSERKRRITINPHPKKADTIHYRDLVKQNDWLRSNVFDSLGNYLYCAACVRSALGVSKDRLARQCNIKRRQSQQPLSKW